MIILSLELICETIIRSAKNIIGILDSPFNLKQNTGIVDSSQWINNFFTFTLSNRSPKFQWFDKNLNIFTKYLLQCFLRQNDEFMWENLQKNVHMPGLGQEGRKMGYQLLANSLRLTALKNNHSPSDMILQNVQKREWILYFFL